MKDNYTLLKQIKQRKEYENLKKYNQRMEERKQRRQDWLDQAIATGYMVTMYRPCLPPLRIDTEKMFKKD